MEASSLFKKMHFCVPQWNSSYHYRSYKAEVTSIILHEPHNQQEFVWPSFFGTLHLTFFGGHQPPFLSFHVFQLTPDSWIEELDIIMNTRRNLDLVSLSVALLYFIFYGKVLFSLTIVSCSYTEQNFVFASIFHILRLKIQDKFLHKAD